MPFRDPHPLCSNSCESTWCWFYQTQTCTTVATPVPTGAEVAILHSQPRGHTHSGYKHSRQGQVLDLLSLTKHRLKTLDSLRDAQRFCHQANDTHLQCELLQVWWLRKGRCWDRDAWPALAALRKVAELQPGQVPAPNPSVSSNGSEPLRKRLCPCRSAVG